MRRPVRVRSKALVRPKRDLSRGPPPAPGMIPSLVSGRPTSVAGVKIRNVVARASSRPPPRAMDEMAEMVGMYSLARFSSVRRKRSRNSCVLRLGQWIEPREKNII